MSKSIEPWSVIYKDVTTGLTSSLQPDIVRAWFVGYRHRETATIASDCMNALAGIVTEEYTADDFVKHVRCLCNYLDRDKNTVMQNLNMRYALEQLTAALARKDAAK